MSTHPARRILLRTAALAAASLLPGAAHAVGLSISPPTIASDYSGTLTLDVTGLTAGTTVRVDSFVDLDGNGSLGAGEPLVQSFVVTDGQQLSFGGVRLSAVPGDEDGAADGKIQAVLHFPDLAEGMKAAAHYLHRVSGGMPPITPVTVPYVVSAPSQAQHVEGTIFSGGPVPRAFTFLLSDDADGPVAVGLADGTGHYSLRAPPGTYSVAAVKDGFVLSSPPQVVLGAGATVMQDVTLTAADRTIAGSLVDSVTADGIPGVQLFVSDNPDNHGGEPFTVAFTDADGHFAVPVVSGATWRIETSGQDMALGGWMAPDTRPAIDTTGGGVTGISISLRRATAVIHGTVRDGANGIAGLRVEVDGAGRRSQATTDALGQYQCAAAAGTWMVSIDSDQLASRGYFSSQSVQADVEDGQAKLVDFDLLGVTGHIQGHVRDVAEAPIAGAGVVACQELAGGGSGPCTFTNAGEDGSYDIGVSAGDWMVSGESDDFASRGYVSPHLSVSVADGATVTGVDIVARAVTAHVVGDVKDTGATAVPDVFVIASQLVSGVEYTAGSRTIADGSYSLGVFDGSWQVSLSCGDVVSRGFTCPSSVPVVVSGGDETLHWVLHGVACTGDCNGNGSVSADEIHSMVDMALGLAPLGDCTIADANADQQVTVSDIVAAVLRKQAGCQPA